MRLTGRLLGADGRSASFADDLVATTTAAHHALSQTLARIDTYIDRSGLGAHLAPPDPLTPICIEAPLERLDLRAQGISSVLWTLGYFRRYEWLHLPALDAFGEIAHTRGVTSQPGLFVVGQRFQHRRDSNFIDGVRHDAAYIVNHLATRRGASRSPRSLHVVTKDARRIDVTVAP